MTDPFTKPFADLFKMAPYGQMPGQMQNLVTDGLAKTREATLQSIAAAKNGAETFGKVSPVAAKETGEFTAKAFEQAVENTEAAFLTAQAIALSTSPIEAAQLQAKYAQAQFAKTGEQAKELFDLWTRLAQKSFSGVKA